MGDRAQMDVKQSKLSDPNNSLSDMYLLGRRLISTGRCVVVARYAPARGDESAGENDDSAVIALLSLCRSIIHIISLKFREAR